MCLKPGIYKHGTAQYFWFSFVTISGAKINWTRLIELKSVMKCWLRYAKNFTSVFLIRTESFIQVRLIFNVCGFLVSIPLGNEFCFFLVSAVLMLARLAIHPELLIRGYLRAAEWRRCLILSVDAGIRLQLLFSGGDCSYCFSFKWIREKCPLSIKILLLYVAPRPCLN